MAQLPSVGIMMAARNAASTIGPALESLKVQEYRGRISIVVVDDGSTDDTAWVASQFEAVKVIRLPHNVGRSGARNFALDALETDFVAVQDADDIAKPNRISESVELAGDVPNIVVGGQLEWLDPVNGPYVGGQWPQDPTITTNLLGAGRMPVAHPTLMARRHLLLDVHGYSTRYPVAEDLDLLVRIKRKYPSTVFINSALTFVTYRRPQSEAVRYTLDSVKWRHQVMRDHPSFFGDVSRQSLAMDISLIAARRAARRIRSRIRRER